MEINQTEITHVAQTTETAPAPTPQPAPAPTPAMSLLSLLEGFLSGYIQTAVDKRVAEIMQCRENLNTIDEALETRIREIAAEVADEYADTAISSHERDESHHSENDIEHLVESAMNNYDFSNIVYDAVQDAVDNIDLEDKISDAIDNIDIDDKINTKVETILTTATIKLEF